HISREMTQEFATPIGTLHLAVTKQVDVRQNPFLQDVERLAVVLSPVVAIGKLEAVEIPLAGGKLLFKQLSAYLVGRTDPCPPTFPGVIKRVFVDRLGHSVV